MEFAKDSWAVCEGNAWIMFPSMMVSMYSGVVREYTADYNQERPHQGIGQRIPNHYDLLKSKPTGGRIRTRVILGGLHQSYTRATYFN